MLSDVFENAKNLLADIYYLDADETYVCTITSRQSALEFERKRSRPKEYKIVFRTRDGVYLCTQRFKKIDEVTEQINKENHEN